MILLPIAFFVTALLYASVGFGGGSTYAALLILGGTELPAVPILSLLCNLVVVTLGSWRFGSSGNVPWRKAWPLFILSVPMAWIGGRLPVSDLLFVGLLAITLLVAGVTMLFQKRRDEEPAPRPRVPWQEPLIGAVLGLVAGIVGIGGGIFLAPVLHLMRWDRARAIAGTCALFILVNSVAGLFGQVAKSGTDVLVNTASAHWLLFPAVAAGGFLGSYVGVKRLRTRHVAVVTAILVLYVAAQLCWRFVSMLQGDAS